ncbi:hypothetical protein [Sphingobacterium tabacisoli]|uniref:Uncharacterized protein n=1 Tax=Sphingobacterium tabacisoli TaxID=2044855 RepID=A0ABW5L384_9SPHI|nr:hypothetical protein [Sphingobacterium tabacisoli]
MRYEQGSNPSLSAEKPSSKDEGFLRLRGMRTRRDGLGSIPEGLRFSCRRPVGLSQSFAKSPLKSVQVR